MVVARDLRDTGNFSFQLSTVPPYRDWNSATLTLQLSFLLAVELNLVID